MTTQTPATAEIEKWLRVRFFPKFWLRIRVRKKNAESGRSRLWWTGSGPTSVSDATQMCSRSPTSVWNYHNNDHNCVQHSTDRGDGYCVTHGHGLSCWK